MKENMIQIVPLTLELVPQVACIEAMSFSEPWSEQAYRQVCQKEEYVYMAAVDQNGTAVGMCGMLIGPFEAEVMNVAVHPDYRGQGIAGKMMKVLLQAGKERGVTEFTLEVRVTNEAAIHVYEANGFVSEGIRPNFYTKPKEDALIMWKR